MTGKAPDEAYSEEETVARREAALKRMLATPPAKHKPLGARKVAKQKRAPETPNGEG
jgi:hypothetical protein